MSVTSRLWRQGAALLLLSGLSAVSLLPVPAAQAAALTSAHLAPMTSPTANGLVGRTVAITRVAGTKLAVVGAPGVNRGVGAVYVYAQHGATWRRQATLTEPGGTARSDFGSAVAAAGSTIVVGMGYGGHAYVYQHSGTSWRLQATLVSPDGSRQFGSAVAISGTTIVVGDDNDGAAYIYQLAQGVWSQQAVLNDPRGPDHRFGTAVAVSGSTAMVGGLNEAYVFADSGSGWTEQASLKGFGQYFGEALSIEGSTAVVGAQGAYDNAGRAYVFQRVGQVWKPAATLRDPVHAIRLTFGYAVAISGRRVVVGAPADFYRTPRCGTTYEFTKSGAGWRYRAQQTDPGCKRGNGFGWAVALMGRTAVIGAPTTNHNVGAAFEVTVP